MSDEAPPAQTDLPPPVKPSRFKRFRRFIMRLTVMVVIPAAAALAGVTYYYSGGRYVTTENAFIKAPITSVVSQVSGRVERILVREHDVVVSGQKLLQLERHEFELKVEEAKANLAAVVQEIENSRAELRRVRAEMKVVQERQRYLATAYKREEELAKQGIGLKTKLDEAQHLMLSEERNLIATREKESAALAALGGNPDLPDEAHPKHIAATARLNRAHLDLQRSELIAPATGIVARLNLERGEYIKDGDDLFAIVQTNDNWVEVNLKETQLTHIKVGQKATFVAESYPDVEWTAEVKGISPATGAEFAVLPPQNASGNWVKVVQRLPVRLRIHRDENADLPELRAGMSVAVSIDTERQRTAPPLISGVLAATRNIVGASAGQ
ncbi:MAG: HlyD family secretion protein [Pseudomonadota bacterium]